MRVKRIVCMTFAAAAVLGCAEEAPSRSTDTTRALLSQPRAADVSTSVDPSSLSPGDGTLTIDQLGMNAGSRDAPVKVIEFVDFGCGFCRRFQLETFPTIRTEFIATGMIEWKFLPFISGSFTNSLVVTEAAECVFAQHARLFGALEERLWADQAEWKASGEPEALIRRWAVGLGADGEAFDACMRDDSRLDRVNSSTAFASELGVRSTPTFWIVGGGPVQGALPLEVFRQLFTEVYEQVTQG
ncbi:MAG: DsbA family protein [Gemmatimonadota bacterium]|nr:DsbA family protein [Gemmatimonadota bacterium]